MIPLSIHKDRVVLAYSGGLDTSVAIGWIGEATGREVVAVAVDVGQGGEDLEVIRQRALDCGAVEAYVADARDEFANDYCMPALKANALYEGTYPLPEAQVDRFMLKVIINYPKKEEEKQVIRQNITGHAPEIRPVMDTKQIMAARDIVREVYIDEKIERYIVDIVFATRFPQEYGLADLQSMIAFAASPRASLNLALASRAYAFIKQRGYVIPEDVRAVCHDVMRHRIGLSYEAEANNLTSEAIVSEILNKVEVP